MNDNFQNTLFKTVCKLMRIDKNIIEINIPITAVALFSLMPVSHAIADDYKSDLDRDELGHIIYQERFGVNNGKLKSEVKSLILEKAKIYRYDELNKYKEYICTEISSRYRICYTNYYWVFPAFAQPGHEHRTEWNVLIIYDKHRKGYNSIDQVKISSHSKIE